MKDALLRALLAKHAKAENTPAQTAKAVVPAPASPTRKWSERDVPVAAAPPRTPAKAAPSNPYWSQRNGSARKPAPTPGHSIHHRVLSRTGK
jgi:hypothetical protein